MFFGIQRFVGVFSLLKTDVFFKKTNARQEQNTIQMSFDQLEGKQMDCLGKDKGKAKGLDFWASMALVFFDFGVIFWGVLVF